MAVEYRGQGRFEIVHGCAQTSTNSLVVVTGSELDVRGWRSVEYTISVATNSVKWTVYADNDSAFGTEVVVKAEATVAALATGTYSIANAPYTDYRIKIDSAVDDVHGKVSITALMTG